MSDDLPAATLPNHRKCAIVLNACLSPGLAANAAAVLAASLGRTHPEIIGPDVCDASGCVHPGITAIPLPVLRADADGLRRLAISAREAGLGVCGFTDLAQRSRRYDEYTARMASTAAPELTYVGLSLFGDVSAVNRLTGDLGLYQ